MNSLYDTRVSLVLTPGCHITCLYCTNIPRIHVVSFISVPDRNQDCFWLKKNVTDSSTARNTIPIKNTTNNKYTIAFSCTNLLHELIKSFAGTLPDHVKSNPD